MTPGRTTSKSELDWKLLTKKRTSSTKGITARKEDLAWVSNVSLSFMANTTLFLSTPS